MGWRSCGFPRYVPVAERRRKAMAQMGKLRKNGKIIAPVLIEGRQIARTFWGKAWCDHLDKFSDYENRLPRGRTYVRNGSVCHLEIKKSEVSAQVMGSHLYKVKVSVREVSAERWKAIKKNCAGQVASMMDLLRGELSTQVMQVICDRDKGLFPLPREITFECSCPDWAEMCKHVAAVIYGVGARLDENPELLFLLRGVNHEELLGSAQAGGIIDKGRKDGKHKKLSDANLDEVFGIEIAESFRKRGGKPATASSRPRIKGKRKAGSKRHAR